MLNTGKEKYDNVQIDDEKLLAAIECGIRRDRLRQRRLWMRSTVAAAACFVIILYGCANIPVLYAYACEIPVIKTFVRALRIGGGGKELENAQARISADSRSVTISFSSDGKITDEVLSYSIAYQRAPSRLQMTFPGAGDDFYSQLKSKMEGMEAVKEIYQIETSGEKGITFVVVLNRLYNYELTEYSDPGSLTIRFYQDAYYTENEKYPEQA